MRRAMAVVGAAFLILALTGPVAAASGREHAVHYYLSLGDSLAAGEQPIGDPTDKYRTADGYADQLYGIAHAQIPKLRHIKLGCPGETTVTMIDGGICPYEYGSQLGTALEFLHAHAKYVSFITIDIGWNDLDVATPCVIDHPDQALECLQPQLLQVAGHMPTILAALKDAAPGVPIIGMNLYDPFLAYWLQGQVGLAQLSVDLITGSSGVNAFIEAFYGAAGIPVADVETAFQTTNWTMVAFPPPYGQVPQNVATICSYTWVCVPPPLGPNNHANHDGYHAMAEAFAAILGY